MPLSSVRGRLPLPSKAVVDYTVARISELTIDQLRDDAVWLYYTTVDGTNRIYIPPTDSDSADYSETFLLPDITAVSIRPVSGGDWVRHNVRVTARTVLREDDYCSSTSPVETTYTTSYSSLLAVPDNNGYLRIVCTSAINLEWYDDNDEKVAVTDQSSIPPPRINVAGVYSRVEVLDTCTQVKVQGVSQGGSFYMNGIIDFGSKEDL